MGDQAAIGASAERALPPADLVLGELLPGGISRAALEAVRRPLATAQVLPPRCYVDEDFHRFEVDQVLMRNWIPVGRTEQVAEPGDYFTVTRLGERVIVLRDSNGRLRALSAVCRHRGFPIADDAGNCGRKGFVCPYHGWRYRTDGTLAAAPFMQEGFDASQWRLPEFGIDEWQGFLFINFDRAAPLLSPQLKTLDKVLAPFQLGKMKTAPLRSLQWPGNWKATLDNFTEAYHQPFIHPGTFEPWAPARLGIYEDVDGPYNLFWLPSKDGNPLPTVFEPLPGMEERYRNSFMVVNIFPYFHFLFDASCAVSLDMDIRGASDLRCSWSIHVSPEEHARPDFAERAQTFLDLLMPTYNEDEDACRRAPLGQRSRFAEQGQYSWMEKSVHQFHSWIAGQYLA